MFEKCKKSQRACVKLLHNPNSGAVVGPDDAVLSSNSNTQDYLSEVAVHSSLFEKMGRKGRNEMIVKITYVDAQGGRHRIWRKANAKGVSGIDGGSIGLPAPAIFALSMHNAPYGEVSIENSCRFMLYLNEANDSIRTSFRLGLLSILLAIIGMIVSVSF